MVKAGQGGWYSIGTVLRGQARPHDWITRVRALTFSTPGPYSSRKVHMILVYTRPSKPSLVSRVARSRPKHQARTFFPAPLGP